jgi:hypothetical protein
METTLSLANPAKCVTRMPPAQCQATSQMFSKSRGIQGVFPPMTKLIAAEAGGHNVCWCRPSSGASGYQVFRRTCKPRRRARCTCAAAGEPHWRLAVITAAVLLLEGSSPQTNDTSFHWDSKNWSPYHPFSGYQRASDFQPPSLSPRVPMCLVLSNRHVTADCSFRPVGQDLQVSVLEEPNLSRRS